MSYLWYLDYLKWILFVIWYSVVKKIVKDLQDYVIRNTIKNLIYLKCHFAPKAEYSKDDKNRCQDIQMSNFKISCKML